MNPKIIDFQAGRESQLHKRKEAKLDAMRQAFRRARDGADEAASKSPATKKKRRKSKK